MVAGYHQRRIPKLLPKNVRQSLNKKTTRNVNFGKHSFWYIFRQDKISVHLLLLNRYFNRSASVRRGMSFLLTSFAQLGRFFVVLEQGRQWQRGEVRRQKTPHLYNGKKSRFFYHLCCEIFVNSSKTLQKQYQNRFHKKFTKSMVRNWPFFAIIYMSLLFSSLFIKFFSPLFLLALQILVFTLVNTSQSIVVVVSKVSSRQYGYNVGGLNTNLYQVWRSFALSLGL